MTYLPNQIADGDDAAEGAKANTAATDTTSPWSAISLLKGMLAALGFASDASTVSSAIGLLKAIKASLAGTIAVSFTRLNSGTDSVTTVPSGTQTVGGTVTANLGTLNGAATAAKQPALGAAGSASSDVLTLQGVAGMTPVTAVGVITNPASGSFTRPNDTTAYASGDLVANSTTAGSVTPMQVTVARVAAGNFMLRRVRLRKSSTGTTNASFRAHCYGATISTITNGDNGAWNTSGVADYLGSFDVTMDKVFTDGASGNGVPGIGNEVGAALASGQIVYCLLEARAAYTPVAQETFTLIFEDYQN